MKTVADLKNYLEKNKLSPEELSPRVNISNMTLRRLLKKAPQTHIPERYLLQLSALVQRAAPHDFQNVENMVEYLHESGEAEENIDRLKTSFDEKLKSANVDGGFIDKVNMLAQVAFSSTNRSARLIAIGALLYFVNPMDLIPDYLPVGYVDDLGVITIAITSVASSIPNKIKQLKKL